MSQLLGQVSVIFRKEITYAFRDPDVLIYAVLCPLLLYPLIIIGVSELTLWQLTGKEASARAVHLAGRGNIPPYILTALKTSGKLRLVSSSKPETDLRNGALDAVVTAERRARAIDFQVTTARESSTATVILLEGIIRQARATALKNFLASKQASTDLCEVFSLRKEQILPQLSPSGELLTEDHWATVLTVLLALALAQVIIAGGPASVCMLTEEHEKRTFQTSLLLPVQRFRLILGKFGATLAISLLSGAINVASMSASAILTIYLCAKAMHLTLADLEQLVSRAPPMLMPLIIAFLLSAAFLCSLFLLSVSLAKGFKQGQAIVTLPMLLALPLAFAGVVPGMEINYPLALVPVLNLVLISKHVAVPGGPALVAMVEMLLLPAALLWATYVLYYRSSEETLLPRRLKQEVI